MKKESKINRRDFLKSGMFALGSLAVASSSSAILASTLQGCKVKSKYDTVIYNGIVYTGDGKEGFSGMIGIKDGKINAIGDLGNLNDLRSEALVIDANGNAVTPGFIDIHTHTDTNILEAPLGDSRIFQGITTDIGGNCGDSPFPSSKWESVGGFYESVSKVAPAINYKSFTGQGQLRSFVVGDDNVAATSSQIQQMCSILDREMQEGSAGISCGLEYAPGSYATDNEIEELCRVVAKYNGLLAIHMRNEDDRVEEAVAESINIAKNSGVRLQISHLKAQNEPNWHKAAALVKQIEDAKNSGLDIAFDRYPYVAFSTGLTSFIPLNDRAGSKKDILDRLNNPNKSKEIGKYAESRIARLGGPQNVLIAGCKLPENAKYSGRNLKECSEVSGMDLWSTIKHLLISENLSVQIAGFAMNENSAKLILSNPLCMPASDGSVYSPEGKLGQSIPHPRSYGTFPRFFGKYVREDKICSFAEGVRKCTSLPASRLNLTDRGLIAPNYVADIVIFNPDTISDSATFAEPHKLDHGISHVLVSGIHTINDGVYTGNNGGKIV